MFACPRCSKRLALHRTPDGAIFSCPQCEGRAVSWIVVRRVLSPEYSQYLWQRARHADQVSSLQCPSCGRSMRRVCVGPDHEPTELDLCLLCQFVWFDRGELERLPKRLHGVSRDRQLPEKAREQIALAQIRLAERRTAGGRFGEEPPEELWKWIPALFAMPVEYDANSLRRWPWVTWALAAILVLVAVITWSGDFDQIVIHYGFIPAEALRYGGLTVLAAFFLHAGFWHLVGNGYFLLVFGDNVEDCLGHLRFLGLLAAATVAGAILHWLGDPRSDVPCIGASGGISGIMVYYALRFPRARLGILIRWWFYLRWVYFPAYFGLLFWVLFQLLLAVFQVQGLTNISALGHLGGAAVGAVVWLLSLRRGAPSMPEPISS